MGGGGDQSPQEGDTIPSPSSNGTLNYTMKSTETPVVEAPTLRAFIQQISPHLADPISTENRRLGRKRQKARRL